MVSSNVLEKPAQVRIFLDEVFDFLDSFLPSLEEVSRIHLESQEPSEDLQAMSHDQLVWATQVKRDVGPDRGALEIEPCGRPP